MAYLRALYCGQNTYFWRTKCVRPIFDLNITYYESRLLGRALQIRQNLLEIEANAYEGVSFVTSILIWWKQIMGDGGIMLIANEKSLTQEVRQKRNISDRRTKG